MTCDGFELTSLRAKFRESDVRGLHKRVSPNSTVKRETSKSCISRKKNDDLCTKMENGEGFSGEMMQMYSKLLMQSNTMALNNMLATITAMQTKVPINPDIFVAEAAKQLTSTTPEKPCKPRNEPSTTSPTPRSSDEIPIDEIECDIGTFVAKNFQRYLKLNKGSLDGGDPNGFQLMLTQLCENPLYKSSPPASKQSRHLAGTKRKLSGSPITQVSLFKSPGRDNRNEEEEDQDNCKRFKTELNGSQNDCNVSQIDELNFTAATNDVTAGDLDSTCEMDATAGVLDVTAEMSKTAENLDKTGADLNDTAEQTVNKSQVKIPNGHQSFSSRPKGKHAPFSCAEVEMRFNRLREIQRRKPKIDVDVSQLPYHSNMRRQYANTVRSAEAQLKRDKNTIAARISRIRNKYYEQILQKKGTEMLAENINWKRKIACYRTYGNKLIEMLGLEPVDFGEMWEKFVKDKRDKEATEKLKKKEGGKELDKKA